MAARIHPVREIITQEHIDQFCRRATALSNSQAVQKELREDILQWVLKGKALPAEGPWEIKFSQNGGKEFDWEEEYIRLYAKYLRLQNEYTVNESMALARAFTAEKKEKFPLKETVNILGTDYVGGVKFNVKPNPNYKRKPMPVRKQRDAA